VEKGCVVASTINAGKPRIVGQNFFIEADGTKTMYKSTIRILGRYLPIHVLSMGNPHCVIFVDDVENFPVEKYGQLIESHPIFPERTNVEFIEIMDKDYLIQRTWERGCGETLSCGTGACAAAVSSHIVNNTDRKVKVELKGGILEVEYTENGDILTSGPSVKVFDGVWP
jgi:diaminopimelate epimerase